jgi:asparaginyl-tRNA synthetase
VYVNTPIITGSDAEGAGEIKVTALPFDTPRTEEGKVNYKEDFWKRNQFNGFWTIRRRDFAMALGQIYTLDLRLEQRILTLHVLLSFG